MPALSRIAPAGAGSVAVLCWLFGSGPLFAQASAALDVGVSEIRYDQFLPSWAFAASPSFGFDHGLTSAAARGSLVRFQSGHMDLHGSIVATTFTPAIGRLRGELTADGGASRYLSLPAFSHLFGRAHLHWLSQRYGYWAGASLGRTSMGMGPRGAATVDVGFWGRWSAATIRATALHGWVGDTTYTDVESTAQAGRGAIELRGLVGARVWSRAAGRGMYGEASATINLDRHLGLVIGAGRYPADPTRGTIAGRYLALGIHLSTSSSGPVTTGYADPMALVLPGATLPGEVPDGPTLEVGESTREGRAIEVHAPGAEAVQIMGDFTDWQAIALTRTAGDLWRIVLPLAPGSHFVEVRINSGLWRAPALMTRVADDFGGEMGLLVVP